MKTIQVCYLDGTLKETLDLEEQRKKYAWVSAKPLSDEDIINVLNYLASNYIYKLK